MSNPNMLSRELSPEQADALEVARHLARNGVPLFVARPATDDDAPYFRKLGFVLPKWRDAVADPAVADQWRPGWALGAVMGRAMDLLDLDTHKGTGTVPAELHADVAASVLGAARTPSGGMHLFVAPLGEGSHDNVWPGVDVKGGRPDGTSVGLAFIAPTVKTSKATGEPRPYTWETPPVFAGKPRSEALASAVRSAFAAEGRSARTGSTADLPEWQRAYLDQRAPVPPAAADRAIAEKLADVAAYGPNSGFRSVIRDAAYTLGGFVGAGHLAHDDAERRLLAAVAEAWGAPDEDDREWIREGLATGAERKFSVADPLAAPEAVAGVRHEHVPFDPRRPFGAEPFVFHGGSDDQDIADAALARAYRGARVLWADASTGSVPWLMYDERGGHAAWHYVADGSKTVLQSLRDTMPAGVQPESKDRAEWTEDNWAWHARNRVLKGMASIAGLMDARVRRRGHYAIVTSEEMDADPALLWCAGAAWSMNPLRPAEQPPSVPFLRSSRWTPADVPTPAWDAYVSALWPDKAVADWALRVLAVGFTGKSEGVMPILYGPPGRGKTTLMNRLLNLLGGYGAKASTALIQPHIGNGDVAKAELQGVRLAWLDEGLGTGKASVEAVKDITGGGQVYAAAKYRAPVRFEATHTLVLTTNNEPEIHDEGLARRARIIPCEGDSAEVSRTLRVLLAVWEQEAPGILARMMRLGGEYLDDLNTVGLDRQPAAVREIVDTIREDQDVIGLWLMECTREDEQGTRSSDLYTAFCDYARRFPEWSKRPPASNVWGKRLDAAGYGVHKRPRNVKYRPLALTSGDYSGRQTPNLVSWADTGVTSRSGGPSGSPSHPTTCDNGPIVTSVTPPTPLSSRDEEEGENAIGGKQWESGGNTHHPEPGAAEPVGPDADGTCSACGQSPGVTTQGRLRSHKADGAKCPGSGEKVPGRVTPAQAKRAAAAAELAGETLTLPAAMRRGEAPRSVSTDEARAILDECLERNGGTLAVDIETNALPQWHPGYRVTTIQLGDWREAVDLDADDPEHRELARIMLGRAVELNAHSYTADLAPLARLGVIADYDAACRKTVDTATRAKLADPHLTDNSDGLKDLAKALLGDKAESPSAEAAKDALGSAAGWIWKLKPDTPEAKNGWLQIDKRCATMVRYALSDVLDCAAVRRVLPEPEPEVDARERLAQRVTAAAPLVGIELDGDAVEAQLSEREPRAAEKLARINALGVGNPDSPKQVTARLAELGAVLPRTESGNPSGAKDVLEKLEAAPGELGELAVLLREYRDDATVLKNMIRPWSRSTRGGDSRTYPTVYTLGADTGRMSCVRPNLQQVAREGGLRECLSAGPGYKIIAADFSSVEVRVAAALSQDPTLIQFIREGKDLHGEIAELAFGPGFTKAQRYGVKRIVFGRLYGGGLDTLARQAGLDHETTQRCIDVLDALAPGLRAWSDGLKGAVKNGLRDFRTYSGRVVHLDPDAPHKAPNYAIQGTARELLIDGLVRWDAGPYAGGVILPVHDEVVAWVPQDVADDAVRVLEACMTTELFGVPIDVEADAPADRWQSAA